jgi:transposase
VKPFVKRQKKDMADAEAISEAAVCPTMRFVAVKSAEKQASGMVFKSGTCWSGNTRRRSMRYAVT